MLVTRLFKYVDSFFETVVFFFTHAIKLQPFDSRRDADKVTPEIRPGNKCMHGDSSD